MSDAHQLFEYSDAKLAVGIQKRATTVIVFSELSAELIFTQELVGHERQSNPRVRPPIKIVQLHGGQIMDYIDRSLLQPENC